MSLENPGNSRHNSTNNFSIQNDEEEQIPDAITPEYLKDLNSYYQNVIRDLRQDEHYKIANDIMKLLTVCDNLSSNLVEERLENAKLHENHLDATGRIALAIKISQNDQDTLEKLRKEIEHAWSVADAANTREQHSDELMQHLRVKYDELVKSCNLTEKTLEADEVIGLGKHKDTIVIECERLTVEVFELNKRLQVQRNYSEEMTKKLQGSENNFNELYKKLDDMFHESFKEKKELETLRILYDVLLGEKVILEDNLQHYMTKSEELNKELKINEDKYASIKEVLLKKKAENFMNSEKIKKNEAELEILKKLKNDVALELKETKKAMSLTEDYQKNLVFENHKKTKEIESLSRKIIQVEKTKSAVDQEILTFRSNKITLEKERDLANKYNEEKKKEIEKLLKSIELLQKDLEKSAKTIEEFKDIKAFLEESAAQLKKEIKKLAALDKKSKATIKALSTRAEEFQSELDYLREEIEILVEDGKLKDQSVVEFKKTADYCNAKLMQIKIEGNKGLVKIKELKIELEKSEEEGRDLNDRWIKTEAQVEEIHDALALKIKEIVVLTKDNKLLDKKVLELKRDLEKSEVSVIKAHKEIVEIRLENNKYMEALRENDERFVRQKNDLDKILREKDLLATQMLRKADESALLRKELSLLQISIEEANKFINKKLDEIRLLSIEVKILQAQCKLLKNGLINTTDMRHEVLQLNRKLNQEQTKSTALAEIMNTPQNIHRWRKLGCMDPKKMDLIIKCQRLQKRLLAKTSKLIKTERTIKDLHKKFETLEQATVKKPNQQVLEKLNVTRSQLTQNTKRMKAAVAISRANVNDLSLKDTTIDQLQKDIERLKTQLFKEKKEKSSLKEVNKSLLEDKNATCKQKL